MPDPVPVNPNQPVPPGLINQAPGSTTQVPGVPPPGATPGAPVTSYNPAQAEAKTATAQAYTVDPAKATVAGQIKSLLDAGSPLLEQAETNARQQMGARGLLNSTQAISAGQQALYAAALPIASADSATYDRAATNTTNVANQFELSNSQLETQTGQFNAGAQNTALGQAAQAANQQSLTAQQIAGQKDITAQQIAGQKDIAVYQGGIQQQIAQLQADTTLTAQERANASAQLIARLQADTSLTVADKQTAASQAIAALQASTSLSIADKNIASSQLIAQLQSETTLTATDKTILSNQTIAGMNRETQLELGKLQSDTTLTAADKQSQSQQIVASLNNETSKIIANLQSNTQLTVADKNNATSTAIAGMQKTTQEYLGRLQSDTSLSVQDKAVAGNKAVAEINTSMQKAIADLNANTSMSIADKQSATQQLIAQMNNENSQALQDKVNAGNLANIQANGIINEKLTVLQNDNKVLLQTSAGAKDLYAQALVKMTDVINNPDFDINQKTQALNNLVTSLNDGLSVLGGMGKIPDLGSTLMFGSGNAYGSEDQKAIKSDIANTWKSVLGRDIDQTGIDNWMAAIVNGGKSIDFMRQTLMNSEEYKLKNPG